MKKALSAVAGGVLMFGIGAGTVMAQPAGKAIVDNACIKCHSLKRVESAAKNAAEWEVTLDRMTKKGAKIRMEDRDTVLKYLSTLNK